MLNPDQDIQTNKYALDKEVEEIAYLIRQYDKLWNNKLDCLKQAEIALQNKEDELKELKGRLAFDVKYNYKNYELDKSPSDKMAENKVFDLPEYKEFVNELRKLRSELAKAEVEENEFKNFHFNLICKKEKISELITLWLNEYYSESKIDAEVLREKIKIDGKEEVDFSNELTTKMNQKRKLKGEDN